LESESVIKSVIHNRFPQHEIISEEGNPDNELDSEYVWIVDPIDGTVNFQHGFSQFCVGIAMLDKQGIRASVIHNPVSEEMYTAVRGNGSKLNGNDIRVSETNSMGESLIAASWSDREFSETKIFDALRDIHTSSHGFRKTGSAVLSMAMTAAGIFDGHCLLSLGKWDVAAGILLVEEAGGKVTNLAGEDDHRKILNDSIVATNGRIHKGFRNALQLP
jgi:myo-inositol-1(or 4)-monophosphatase